MNNNQYYKPNIFARGWQKIVSLVKNTKAAKFDAVSGAIGFFVILVAMLEYKVFESMYGMTGDIILTISTLLVTAFGGVYSEVVLRRNEDATDDQNLYADWIFYISLVTSAFVGLGAWAQAINLSEINLYFVSITLPDFAATSVAIITLVTLADILILRAYFRADVNAVHARNIAQANSKKKQADLKVEDALIDFEADVKAQTEQILRIEARRVEIRAELNRMYGGRVPPEVMESAMKKLDEIMKEVKTGNDDNGDGHVGLPPTRPVQPTQQASFQRPVNSYASQVETPNFPSGGENQQ